MRDFLKGTLGTVLQVVLVFLGVVLLGASCVAGVYSSAMGIVCLVLSILCFCTVAGIRYWLGHIVRMR